MAGCDRVSLSLIVVSRGMQQLPWGALYFHMCKGVLQRGRKLDRLFPPGGLHGRQMAP
jgi:hypothetical protein